MEKESIWYKMAKEFGAGLCRLFHGTKNLEWLSKEKQKKWGVTYHAYCKICDRKVY